MATNRCLGRDLAELSESRKGCLSSSSRSQSQSLLPVLVDAPGFPADLIRRMFIGPFVTHTPRRWAETHGEKPATNYSFTSENARSPPKVCWFTFKKCSCDLQHTCLHFFFIFSACSGLCGCGDIYYFADNKQKWVAHLATCSFICVELLRVLNRMQGEKKIK